MSDPQVAEVSAEPVVNKRIRQYIEVRDKIKEMQERHKAELAPLTDALNKLNGVILEHFNTQGGDSLTVRGVGTAYRTTKDSATIANGDEFKRWVIGGTLWEMVDWTANKTAVREYIEKNHAPPPGVNFRSVAVVGVRRA